MNLERPDSVRLALPAEAAAIAQIQLACLATRPGLSDLVAELDAQPMADSWAEAIMRPPLASYRVLVGLDAGEDVVGFAAVGPSDDPDAEATDAVVAEFCVHPDQVAGGHDDRLMHAIADTLRLDGFTRATWWVPADDDATRAFLTESGWEPDGAHREIGDDDGRHRVKLIRLHTSLV